MPIATKLCLDTCNMACQYCYQTPESRVNRHSRNYDLEKVLNTIEEWYNETNAHITIHSGEASILHPKDLEKLLKKSYELRGESSIQTNGYNIDEHWDLFEKYNTSLGFSFDGKEEANMLRGWGNKEKRIVIAKKVENNIDEALDRDLNCSMISVIHRKNGIEYFEKLKQFLIEHPELSGRLNPASITQNIDCKPNYELTVEELKDVYDKLYDVVVEHGLDYSPFRDIGNSLTGKDNVVCVFSDACDIYSTNSLLGVDKDGRRINCIKTYHTDVIYPRAERNRSDIREQVLKETDCRGCEWFDYCKGGCANDGIDDDWRRKSRFCGLYKHLFKKIENNLKSIGMLKNHKCKETEDVTKKKHRGDYTDGIRHEDSNLVHLDSDMGDRCE